MAASSPSPDMEDTLDEFTCHVCFELYKEPITLPCSHTFCHVCIEKCWESRRKGTDCVCPNCHEVFQEKPKFKKNIIIANFVEKLKLKKREVGFGVGELRCINHRKPILLFCKDDGSLMCSKCTVGQHQDHIVLPVEVAHAELKVSKSVTKMVVNPTLFEQNAEDKLEEKRREVCQLVNEYVDLMKSQINNRKMEKLSLLEKQREKLEQQMEALRQGKSAMETALQDLEAISFLQVWLTVNILQKLTATLTETKQPYQEHPDRFDCYPQVVSSESFSSGRHYWEVDASLSRKECGLGGNPESWCFGKCDNKYSACHNYQETPLSMSGDPERFGFFLDCEAGELTLTDLKHFFPFIFSFHSKSEPTNICPCSTLGNNLIFL
uniref:Uncharacterized protein n=1 Tax=Eptatretus burgeri TaxID=7764 RepID=A0A8C4QIM2_EPTBU